MKYGDSVEKRLVIDTKVTVAENEKELEDFITEARRQIQAVRKARRAAGCPD